jgi:hypothetical protein
VRRCWRRWQGRKLAETALGIFSQQTEGCLKQFHQEHGNFHQPHNFCGFFMIFFGDFTKKYADFTSKI